MQKLLIAQKIDSSALIRADKIFERAKRRII